MVNHFPGEPREDLTLHQTFALLKLPPTTPEGLAVGAYLAGLPGIRQPVLEATDGPLDGGGSGPWDARLASMTWASSLALPLGRPLVDDVVVLQVHHGVFGTAGGVVL